MDGSGCGERALPGASNICKQVSHFTVHRRRNNCPCAFLSPFSIGARQIRRNKIIYITPVLLYRTHSSYPGSHVARRARAHRPTVTAKPRPAPLRHTNNHNHNRTSPAKRRIYEKKKKSRPRINLLITVVIITRTIWYIALYVHDRHPKLPVGGVVPSGDPRIVVSGYGSRRRRLTAPCALPAAGTRATVFSAQMLDGTRARAGSPDFFLPVSRLRTFRNIARSPLAPQTCNAVDGGLPNETEDPARGFPPPPVGSSWNALFWNENTCKPLEIVKTIEGTRVWCCPF